jgi:hypothetical protein
MLRTVRSKLAPAMLAALLCWNAHAQVYSMGVYSAGRTYYQPWGVGYLTNFYGFYEYSDRLDSNGINEMDVTRPAARTVTHTVISFGSRDVTLPITAKTAGYLAIFSIALLAALLVAFLKRRRRRSSF